MQNKKRYWLRGGLSLSIIFIAIALFWWIYISITIGCILEPIQMVNMGGATCSSGDDTIVIIWRFIYFGVPTLLGFVLGIVIGGLFGLTKKWISK